MYSAYFATTYTNSKYSITLVFFGYNQQHILLLRLYRSFISMAIGTEKQQELLNQSYKVKITPLVIYGLRVGTHIHIHTYLHESDFGKPGA